MSLIKLKSLTERIIKHSIGEECPKGFCFSTCFVLSIYLELNGFPNEIICGKMNNTDHFWIYLKDFDVIIDATIKQFDKNQEAIYIGKKIENEITNQYKINQISFNEWLRIYKVFRNPNYDSEGIVPRDKNLVDKIIKHNLINASILIYEIEKFNIKTQSETETSYLYQLYIQSIKDIVTNADENLLSIIKNLINVEFKSLQTKLKL